MKNMARKVFISVLGTGYYGKCRYKKNDFVSAETRYIQQATLEMLSNSGAWTDKDKGIILLTDNARTANWQVAGNKRLNLRTSIEEKYPGLEESIKSLHLPFHVDDVAIPTGSNENEIWQIFDILFGMLQEGDELYFDITHGFRYLPMLVLVLGNYAKFLKRVKISSVTYGNYETRHAMDGVDFAPIIDITALSTLQDWTAAASDFLNHGDASKITACVNSQLKPVLRESKGKDEAAVNFRLLSANLDDLADSVLFCRGLDVCQGNASSKVQDCLRSINGKYLRPLLPILDEVGKFVKRFGNNRPENMLIAANWCAKFGNWQASITLLQEGIVSFFCTRHGINPSDTDSREVINHAFIKKLLVMKDKESEYKRGSEEFENKVNEVIKDCLFTEGLVNDFSNLTDVRNDFNHAGMRNFKKPLKVKNIKANIEKSLERTEGLTDEKNGKCSRLFINLSNHPSASWSKEQTDAAKEYGGILDIPFPQVAPDAMEKDIEDISDALVDKIMAYSRNNEVTAHVMGEMGLTYSLVKRLKKNGIRCVNSTSYRIVEDKGDGKRLVEFHFKKFRDYE